MKVYLGSDHAGYRLKESVKVFLLEHDVKVIDYGNRDYQPDDDYPFFAYKVGQEVAKNKVARGILFCGNAQGICMAANKVDGVRAAVGYSIYGAETSRLDDDSNILCLAGRVVTARQAREIVRVWLETEFSEEIRHRRRLSQVRAIEQKRYRAIEIIPSILEKNYSNFQKKVRKIERFFPLAQIDVADGDFVQNKTFGEWKKIRAIDTDVNFDLHLMVRNPEVYLEGIHSYKRIKRVFFHYESDADIKSLIAYIKKKTSVGIAINPGTPARKIKSLLKQIDAVIVMAVEPGFNGAPFVSPYKKIKQLRSWSESVSIIVDGGVKPTNVQKLLEAGASAVAVGSYLNKAHNWTKAIEKLRGI